MADIATTMDGKMTANGFTLVDLAVIAADRLEGAPVYVLVMQDAVENLPAQTM